jgi:hypothetical protein
MAYQVTPRGISVSALLRAHPMHDYEMFQTLVERHADRIVKVPRRLRDHRRGLGSSPGAGGSTVATPVHEFPQFAVALAGIDILGDDAAAAAVDDGVGALAARAAEIMALRDASVTCAGYLVAFDYLPATMHAELTWLRGFAGSMRSGRPEGQQTDGVAI